MPTDPRNGSLFMKCGICKTEKTKYMGSIMGIPAVMYKPNCACTTPPKGKSDKQMLEHIATPYWQHLDLKPTDKEKKQIKYLKENNMSWNDLRQKQNYGKAVNPSAINEFVNKKEVSEAPQYKKSSKSE